VAVAEAEADGDEDRNPLLLQECQTEAANADRLIDRYGHRLRYVVEWKEWLFWDGQRWERDTGGVAIYELAAQLVRGLWLELEDCPSRNPKRRGIMAAFITRSNTANGIAAMVKIARGRVAVRVRKLDADPWLLNCANGTLDLRTSELREPRPEDYLTKLCPTAYDPKAVSALWVRFLDQVFRDDVGLPRFVRRLLGYGITGVVREHVLPVLWGTGANGKTTLVNAVRHALGADYAGTPPRELFALPRFGERHPAQLMTLQGKRLMMAQESDAGCELNEALIKYLTGGDPITGRGMYENFSSFEPTHKLLLSTNHKPVVRGTDLAIWRRLLLVPFTAVFEDKHCDLALGDKLKAAAPAVLAWLVRGCLEWQAFGLRAPSCVRLATAAYKAEQDVVGAFLRERCEVGPYYSALATDLYKAFRETTASDLTQTAFGLELARRGFADDWMKGGPQHRRKIRRGLRLLD
jgi:putative DNA primase/helicase